MSSADDTLQLYFLCAHPSLSPSSAVPLTLRAVGGLTSRLNAAAYRYSGDVDLATEAIRLTRQLPAAVDHPEVQGLLALMLLHHARRPARADDDVQLVPLADQDRGR